MTHAHHRPVHLKPGITRRTMRPGAQGQGHPHRHGLKSVDDFAVFKSDGSSGSDASRLTPISRSSM